MTRIYNIHLCCGCAISLEGGGALHPCDGADIYDYPGALPLDPLEKELHDWAWKNYQQSSKYLEHGKIIEELNS